MVFRRARLRSDSQRAPIITCARRQAGRNFTQRSGWILLSSSSVDSKLRPLFFFSTSVGSGLALAAWGTFLRAAKDIQANGTFNLLAADAASADLNQLFREKS